jgi:hypothetical protein
MRSRVIGQQQNRFQNRAPDLGKVTAILAATNLRPESRQGNRIPSLLGDHTWSGPLSAGCA